MIALFALLTSDSALDQPITAVYPNTSLPEVMSGLGKQAGIKILVEGEIIFTSTKLSKFISAVRSPKGY